MGYALALLYPTPNLSDPATCNNFTSAEPWFTDRNQYDFRYDQTFSEKDSLFVSYSTYTVDQTIFADQNGDSWSNRALVNTDPRQMQLGLRIAFIRLRSSTNLRK